VQSPDGRVAFRYDAAGRVTHLIQVTDTQNDTGPTTTFAYHDATQLGACPGGSAGRTVETQPDGTEVTHCYDAGGLVTATNTRRATYAESVLADSPRLYYRFQGATCTEPSTAANSAQSTPTPGPFLRAEWWGGSGLNNCGLSSFSPEGGSAIYPVTGPTGGPYQYSRLRVQPASNIVRTIELWVNPRSTLAQRFIRQAHYWSHHQADEDHYGPDYGTDEHGNLQMCESYGPWGPTESRPYVCQTLDARVPVGRWSHIVVTIAPTGDRTLYLNGEATGTLTPRYSSSHYAGVSPHSVLHYQTGRARYGNGVPTAEIDEFATYDTVLPASRIAAHYAAARLPDDSEPELSLGGRLYELRNKLLYADPYALEVQAHDAASGLASVTVELDGTVVAEDSDGCSDPGCVVDLDWTLDVPGENLTRGEHTIRVSATDAAGNTGTIDWRVIRSPYEPLPAEAELVEEALDMRQDNGLSTDEQHIRTLLNDPTYDDSRAMYGTGLTVLEIGSLIALTAQADETAQAFGEMVESESPPPSEDGSTGDPVELYGRSLPGSYAGSYLESGKLHVGFTSDASNHLAHVRTIYQGSVELFPAQFSQQQLESLASQIENDTSALAADGIQILSISVSIQDNAVHVGISDSTPAKTAELVARYGASVEVLEEAEAEPALLRDDLWERMIGGLRINVGTPDGDKCTSGFTYLLGTFIPTHHTLTAGHCAEMFNDVYQGGVRIGSVTRREVGNGLDYLSIATTNRNVSPRVWIKDGSLSSQQLITHTQLDLRRSEKIGSRVCQSGATSGLRPVCGRLTARNVRRFVRGAGWMTNLREFDADGNKKACRLGDSGAPVYLGHMGIGLVHATTTRNRCLYTHIAPTLRSMGLVPRPQDS